MLSLFVTFFRKAVYGGLANLALALTAGSKIQPAGDTVDIYVWQTLGIALFTGLAAVVSKLLRGMTGGATAKPAGS